MGSCGAGCCGTFQENTSGAIVSATPSRLPDAAGFRSAWGGIRDLTRRRAAWCAAMQVVNLVCIVLSFILYVVESYRPINLGEHDIYVVVMVSHPPPPPSPTHSNSV